VTTREDLRRGHEVLGHLLTANTGMGFAIERMQAHEAKHGHLPTDKLRELAGLLHEIADELAEVADLLARPVVESGLQACADDVDTTSVLEKGSAVASADTQLHPIRVKGGIAMADKHSGEDDKQTDHTDKGSDGHTTVSGDDK